MKSMIIAVHSMINKIKNNCKQTIIGLRVNHLNHKPMSEH